MKLKNLINYLLEETARGGEYWYHTTSPENAKLILQGGLRINPSGKGKSRASLDWMPKAYGGITPIFLSRKPGRYHNGVVLKVDVSGLDLVADIPGLVDFDGRLTEDSIYWDEEETPENLWDLMDPDTEESVNGELSFEWLREPNNDISRAAIAITDTAAVIQNIGPERIEAMDMIAENMDEAALRGFSLDILKKETKRLKEQRGYIEDISYGLSQLAEKYDLPYMGRGSSRVVYALSTGKVLKISRDETGIAQTEAEVSVWSNPSTKEVAAQVFDFDPDYNWSVMEIARTFEVPYNDYNGSLEHELGIPTAYGVVFEIRDIADALLSDRSDGLLPEQITDKLLELPRGQEIVLRKRLDKYLENPHPFVNKIVDLIDNNDLNTGDVVSDHFGKTADGRIVLIDYGLSEDVAEQYYE